MKQNAFLIYALFFILNSSLDIWNSRKEASGQEELKGHTSGQERGRKGSRAVWEGPGMNTGI